MTSGTQNVALLAGLALAFTTTTAAAQPAGELVDSVQVEDKAQRDGETTKVRPGRRHVRMALQATGMLALGTAWYWRRDDSNRWGGSNVVDWQLGFKGSALTSKLGFDSDGWRFDGNSCAERAVTWVYCVCWVY